MECESCEPGCRPPTGVSPYMLGNIPDILTVTITWADKQTEKVKSEYRLLIKEQLRFLSENIIFNENN